MRRPEESPFVPAPAVCQPSRPMVFSALAPPPGLPLPHGTSLFRTPSPSECSSRPGDAGGRTSAARFVRFGAKLGRLWSTSGAHIGRTRANTDRSRAKDRRLVENSACATPPGHPHTSSTESGPSLSNFGPSSANVGRAQPNSSRVRSSVAPGGGWGGGLVSWWGKRYGGGMTSGFIAMLVLDTVFRNKCPESPSRALCEVRRAASSCRKMFRRVPGFDEDSDNLLWERRNVSVTCHLPGSRHVSTCFATCLSKFPQSLELAESSPDNSSRPAELAQRPWGTLWATCSEHIVGNLFPTLLPNFCRNP